MRRRAAIHAAQADGADIKSQAVPPGSSAKPLPHSPPATADSPILPLILGVLLTIAAGALVFVELGEPAPQPGFGGIAMSNKIRSLGGQQGLALFRDHLGWLPFDVAGRVLSPDRYLLGLRGSLVAMVALQILAIVATTRGNYPRLWPWIPGPIAAMTVMLAHPPINTDVFSYSSFAWVGRLGENPYLRAPNEFLGDPYAPMNDWTHITAPYGPIWTSLSRAIVRVTDVSPFSTVLLFKVIIAVCAFGLALLAYAFAKQLTRDPRRWVGAFVFVGWSPLLILESAGTAHNDAPMMLLACFGLWLTTVARIGTYRLGMLFVAGAALIKPAALPLLPFMALGRAYANHVPWRRILVQWLLDFGAICVLVAAAFAPYWGGGMVSTMITQQTKFYFTQPMRVNPLWTWIAPGLANGLSGRSAADVVYENRPGAGRVLTVSGLVITTFFAVRTMLRSRTAAFLDPGQARFLWLVKCWAAVTITLSIFPVNAHSWYSIWPLVPIATLWATSGRRGRWWIAAYGIWILTFFIFYHSGRVMPYGT